MEQNRCLGIYVEPDRATVVLAARAGGKIEVIEQFCVATAAGQTPAASAGQQGQQQAFSFAQTARDIAAACREKQLVFTDVAAAIDCRLYRQQTLHSEFTELKQIAQTIKFDAEEALVINAAETAIAFEMTAKGLSGSQVSVFAVPAAVMSEVILALQNNKLDPVTVEPDSICLRRIIQQMPQQDAGAKPIWMILSQKKCFIISPGSQGGSVPVRVFLTTASSNRNAMLAREIILTRTSAAAAQQAGKIKIFDAQASADLADISSRTALNAETFDPAEAIITKSAEQTEPASAGSAEASCDKLGVIVAAGAAAGALVKSEKVDFRPFFLPYQGKKEILKKTVKVLSASLAAMFVILGIFFHLQYYRTNNDRSRLEKKFRAEYTIAMMGAKFTKSAEAVRKLKSEINRIKDVKSGLLSASGEESLEAKLTYLFEALNSVPREVDIDIEKIAVTTKTVNIAGSTSSRGYLQLFAAIDKHPKLSRSSSNYQSKDNRDYFTLTIELKQ